MVKIPIFSDVFGTPAGEISIDNDNISVRHRDLKLTVPIGYLYDAIIVERKELGKIRAKIIIYDTVGIKNEIECIMSDSNFFLLRSFIKRQ
ncbi:MAG: hypothetical protein N3G74_01390 [Candidatus Micrarchaeota archaeon]|nr:hypothetical protein [Candidatus Micrarchaeota archaeon]